MLEDLLSTQHRLAAGATHAADELERSFDCTGTSAYPHVFLKTSFDLASVAAANPANLERPLMGLAVSIKDLFDVAGEVTTAGSVLLQNSAPAQRASAAVAHLRRAGAAMGPAACRCRARSSAGHRFLPHQCSVVTPHRRGQHARRLRHLNALPT
jgi:aspartyl-tRNA(Asn)/glutamyl-tRNA(Gln) amidotransferase subunit A